MTSLQKLRHKQKTIFKDEKGLGFSSKRGTMKDKTEGCSTRKPSIEGE